MKSKRVEKCTHSRHSHKVHHLQGILDDAMTLIFLEVRNHAHTAIILLLVWVVKALGLGKTRERLYGNLEAKSSSMMVMSTEPSIHR